MPSSLHIAQAFVLLLRLAPLQLVSWCGSPLKVPFKSLYFIAWILHVNNHKSYIIIILITVWFTTFSSRSVQWLPLLTVLTLQLERGDEGPCQFLLLDEQQEIYRVNINIWAVVTHS